MFDNTFLIKYAFKNLFRQKRRTLLTSVVIMVSVGSMLFMFAYLNGVLNSIIEDSVKLTGHVNIQHPEYKIKERMISLSVPVDGYAELKTNLSDIEGLAAISGRIKFGGLIDFNENNEPSLGMGIDIEGEKSILQIQKMIVEGTYFSGAPEEMILGSDIAIKLGIKTGDVVTIISSTAYGSMAAGNYKVIGIANMVLGMFNKMFFIPLDNAQYLLDMEDQVTEFVGFCDEISSAEIAKQDILDRNLAGDYEIITWDEQPFLKAYLPMVDAMYIIMVGLFGMVASFSIINTMLMSVLERTREIGVMTAFGMRKSIIVKLFLFEAGVLGFVGGLLGLAFGGSSGYYLETHGLTFSEKLADGFPIAIRTTLYADVEWYHLVISLILGIIISMIASLIPAYKAARTEPTKALRTN